MIALMQISLLEVRLVDSPLKLIRSRRKCRFEYTHDAQINERFSCEGRNVLRSSLDAEGEGKGETQPHHLAAILSYVPHYSEATWLRIITLEPIERT